MIGQMHGDPVEAVRNRRTARTPGFVVRSEHEMINEKLRATLKEVCQRSAPFVGFEPILLPNGNPRQFLSLSCDLVAAPRQFLFGLEQLQARGEPLIACSGFVFWHSWTL